MKNQIITFWTLLFLSTTTWGAQDANKKTDVDWSKLPVAKSSGGGSDDKKDPIWLVDAKIDKNL